MSEWRDTLRQFLIDGGTDGRSQRDVVYYLSNVATSDELLAHLEAWRVEGKVDKYTVPTRGRPGTIWRANTRILSELTKEQQREIGLHAAGDVGSSNSSPRRKRTAV